MGIIEYYDEKEGFGRIKSAVGEQVLFYQTGPLNGTHLKKGLKVSFELHGTLALAVNIAVVDPKTDNR